MTKEQFATVAVGDVLLAKNGRHMHIDEISGDVLHFHWEAAIVPRDRAGSGNQPYTEFGYVRHISKGVQYGTHRTLRHKTDFKTKP